MAVSPPPRSGHSRHNRSIRALLLALVFVLNLAAQKDWVCPMDPDVRSDTAGKCPRCGMKLVLGIPDPVEYQMDLDVQPPLIRVGQPVTLHFRILDPKTQLPVTKYQIVHEKLFHMFVVSQDLNWFVHDHPRFEKDGSFRFEVNFPQPGMYRILSDFYPEGGTPQLITKTLFVPGPTHPTTLKPDMAPKHATNIDVEMITEPAQPIAGEKTIMFFRIKPADGLEKYLGAWGHMLAASADTIDLIHNHPFIADGGPQIQFNLIFPRPQTYRIWVQFQRKGVVNTAVFTVPVSELK